MPAEAADVCRQRQPWVRADVVCQQHENKPQSLQLLTHAVVTPHGGTVSRFHPLVREYDRLQFPSHQQFPAR